MKEEKVSLYRVLPIFGMLISAIVAAGMLCYVNELELDEYYHTDLIGKEVYNQHGKARGYVKEVKELPQCDYLFVHYNGKNYYVPFMKRFIISVTDKIVINELEVLFNEN